MAESERDKQNKRTPAHSGKVQDKSTPKDVPKKFDSSIPVPTSRAGLESFTETKDKDNK